MTMLSGRKVVVVGASSGVGRAFTLAAVGAGAEVVAAARRADRLAAVIAEAGGGLGVVADVSDPQGCARIVAEAEAELGAIDLVFYAAGASPLQHLVATSTDEWRALLETNVIGVQRVIAGSLPHLADGAIVAVLSSEAAAGRTRPGLGAYGTSKAALAESLRAWRLEHPEVRFSCIALGATQPTEFGDGFPRPARPHDGDLVPPRPHAARLHGHHRGGAAARQPVGLGAAPRPAWASRRSCCARPRRWSGTGPDQAGIHHERTGSRKVAVTSRASSHSPQAGQASWGRITWPQPSWRNSTGAPASSGIQRSPHASSDTSTG